MNGLKLKICDTHENAAMVMFNLFLVQLITMHETGDDSFCKPMMTDHKISTTYIITHLMSKFFDINNNSSSSNFAHSKSGWASVS